MVVGICDDDSGIRSFIAGIVKENDPQVTIVQFSDGISLIRYMQMGGKMEILFLDIEFGSGKDGMESAAKIREMMNQESGLAALPLIIFVTGYPERMKEAFGVHAFEFLIKPLKKKELEDVFMKASVEAASILSKQQKKEQLELHINGRTILVPVADIVYIESMGRKLLLHTKERDIECYGKLSDLLSRLGTGYCQIHRSYMINLAFLEDYNRTEVILSGGITVPMSKDRYRSFIDAYLAFGSRL